MFEVMSAASSPSATLQHTFETSLRDIRCMGTEHAAFFEGLSEHLDSLNLQVTSGCPAAERFVSSLTHYQRMQQYSMRSKSKGACERIDTTLDSELKLRTAFVVTPERFSTSTSWKNRCNY